MAHVDGDEIRLALFRRPMQLLEPIEFVVLDDLDLIFLVGHRLRDTRERQRQILRILGGDGRGRSGKRGSRNKFVGKSR